MFKIYDLNMKEIPFPDGVMPLEIFVGSIGKDRVTEAVDGRPGVVDYGFNYTDRPVSLFLRIKAADAADFRLLRNEVFATFDVGSAFYVAEADVPSRVLKVVVDESYIPDRLTEEYADFDINCRTLDSVFWESKYTTLELHDSGYSSTAEKYGLVDNIDDEKVQYRFEPQTSYQNLSNEPFEYGFISSSNGNNSSHERYIRTAGYISVFSGFKYIFQDTGTGANVRAWWLYEYDSSNNFIRAINVSGGAYEFTTQGTRLRLMADTAAGNVLDLNELGTGIRPRLSRRAITNTFTVYNAGNVTIEPENMYLRISLSSMRTYDNDLTVKNLTTGESHVFENGISGGTTYAIEGISVYQNQVNRFRDTNKRFISLVPGDNEFEVNGATYGEIRFDFKFYYK